MVQELLPLLRRSRAGRIAERLDHDGLALGAAQSRLALLPAERLTIALAKSLRNTPIKVNAVCPGWLQTDLGGPDNRAAAPTTAAEGAQIVVAMANLSEDGPTGEFVDGDGPIAW